MIDPYDAVPYTDHAYAESHPERLAVVARLSRFDPLTNRRHQEIARPTKSPATSAREMTAAVRREAIELVVGAIQIRVPAEFDETALGKVLDVVERRR